MVVIRLARTGKKKQAFYRIVVADSKRAVTAKFISIVGWYNPHTKEINVKQEQVAEWLSKGAVPSNAVAILLKKEGMKLPEWVKITEKIAKPKNEPEVKTEAPKAEEAPVEAETAPEATEEVPAEGEQVETTEESAE